jgi:hypothetical protein
MSHRPKIMTGTQSARKLAVAKIEVNVLVGFPSQHEPIVMEIRAAKSYERPWQSHFVTLHEQPLQRNSVGITLATNPVQSPIGSDLIASGCFEAYASFAALRPRQTTSRNPPTRRFVAGECSAPCPARSRRAADRRRFRRADTNAWPTPTADAVAGPRTPRAGISSGNGSQPCRSPSRTTKLGRGVTA